jgi:hypothetical protein
MYISRPTHPGPIRVTGYLTNGLVTRIAVIQVDVWLGGLGSQDSSPTPRKGRLGRAGTPTAGPGDTPAADLEASVGALCRKL